MNNEDIQEVRDLLKKLNLQEDTKPQAIPLVDEYEFYNVIQKLESVNAILQQNLANSQADIDVLKNSIEQIKQDIKNANALTKVVEDKIPNLNDFRIEVNRRLNDVIEKLQFQIASIKIKDFSPDIQQIEKKLVDKIDKKASKEDIPSEVEVKGSKNIKVVREVIKGKVRFTVYTKESTVVIKGSGVDVSSFVKKSGDTMTGDLRGTDFISTSSATVARDSNSLVIQVDKSSGRLILVTRDVNGTIVSVTDSINTWTINRDVNNLLTGVSVT